MTAPVLVMPEPELESRALTLPEQAKAIVIRDQPTYELAATKLLDIAALRKEIVEHHAPMKQAAHEAHKRVCAAEKKLLDPVAEAESILKRGIGSWELEQRRIQEQREREAREAAERAAAELVEQAACEAEDAGASPEEVAAIVEAPLIVPRVAVTPTYQQARGVSTAQVWRAEVFDVRALCRAIADGKVSSEYVQPNMTALNARARAEKQTLQIPGVRAVPEASVRAGGRR